MYHSNTDCTLIFFWYVVVLLTSTTIIPLIYIEPGILFWILLTVWNKIAENNSPEEVSMWKNHKLHYLNCWVYYAELSILDLWLELVTLYQTDLLIFQQYLNVSLLYYDMRYYMNLINLGLRSWVATIKNAICARLEDSPFTKYTISFCATV